MRLIGLDCLPHQVKTLSDLISSFVGGTEEKTAALLEICKGKVLVIDEAFGLGEGMYGAKAIDTIVSKVHNSPGEDIAVLLLGYEDEMMKMLREANPGLMRRCSPESAFRFEDLTDSQLEGQRGHVWQRDERRLWQGADADSQGAG